MSQDGNRYPPYAVYPNRGSETALQSPAHQQGENISRSWQKQYPPSSNTMHVSNSYVHPQTDGSSSYNAGHIGDVLTPPVVPSQQVSNSATHSSNWGHSSTLSAALSHPRQTGNIRNGNGALCFIHHLCYTHVHQVSPSLSDFARGLDEFGLGMGTPRPTNTVPTHASCFPGYASASTVDNSQAARPVLDTRFGYALKHDQPPTADYTTPGQSTTTDIISTEAEEDASYPPITALTPESIEYSPTEEVKSSTKRHKANGAAKGSDTPAKLRSLNQRQAEEKAKEKLDKSFGKLRKAAHEDDKVHKADLLNRVADKYQELEKSNIELKGTTESQRGHMLLLQKRVVYLEDLVKQGGWQHLL
ncbi:hypothetical protein SISSUDRAFT_89224 [Sistotremastrum suecicum HHB10207 ss-3]|uniref:Uncharacterized protein n=1 Tax=Sistotremastrum suecicum HHB10207 ss-3 TaxID=1314776 RepID=A0A166B9X7_9AGAM|nr:hypothetical protein SISSUDRAFT_89224 [Sistotremastrum suecicum HHB10207 ss-3]